MISYDAPVRQYIAAHLKTDPTRIALGRSPFPDVPASWLAGQIAARQRAAAKLPGWAANPDLLFPPTRAIEQCSSELTARYKASLVQGHALADLSGGFGVDFSFMAPHFSEAHFCEPNAELIEVVRHNIKVLQLPGAHTHALSAEQFLSAPPLSRFDWAYADPDRRDTHERRLSGLEDCSPNLPALRPRILALVERLLVKTSPLMGLKEGLACLPQTVRIHVVSVRNECKEILFELWAGAPEGPAPPSVPVVCALLHPGREATFFRFTFEEEIAARPEYGPPQAFLFEPDVAILKAGGFKAFAIRWGLRKLHPHSHLYTAEHLPETNGQPFPGRAFQIEGIEKVESGLGRRLGQANISVRNFPATVAELRQKTRLKEGGDCYLFATTLHDGTKTLLRCRRPDEWKGD